MKMRTLQALALGVWTLQDRVHENGVNEKFDALARWREMSDFIAYTAALMNTTSLD